MKWRSGCKPGSQLIPLLFLRFTNIRKKFLHGIFLAITVDAACLPIQRILHETCLAWIHVNVIDRILQMRNVTDCSIEVAFLPKSARLIQKTIDIQS